MTKVPRLQKLFLMVSFVLITLLGLSTGAYGESPTIVVHRDLVFSNTPSGPLLLDLYVPENASGPLPTIVAIPGGGFKTQSRAKFAAEARRFAEAGFVAASIGYRGVPDHTFATTVHDTKAAVRFLRAQAEHYPIDPRRIGAFGQSAGGHLSQMLAVSAGDAAMEGEGGHPEFSSRVQAAVSYAGVSDFISRLKEGGHQGARRDERRESNGRWIGVPFSAESPVWQAASPINYLSHDDPPLLLVHSKDDGVAPFQQSVQMYETMKPMQPYTELLLFEEGGHGIRTSKVIGDEAWAATIAFFNTHLTHNVNLGGLDDDEALFVPAVPPTYRDLSYGPHARNLMDVWTVDSPTPAPVLLSIHGGAFRHGQKKISNHYLRECLKAGISVVTITYRFTEEAIAPAQFEDAARALQFVRHNAASWNMDPTRIASSGGSAGAGISLWLGFHDDMADPDNADPVLRQSTRLTCMAVENGQTSYDPRFIRELFPDSDTWTTGALSKLFGVNLKKLDSLPPEKYALFEAVSALPHLTQDDPPALLIYKSEKDAPIINRSIGIHHPRFGYALKEKMDPLGIACDVLPGVAGKDEVRADAFMAFIKRHLGVG